MTIAHVRHAAVAFSFVVAQACASEPSGSSTGTSPSGESGGTPATDVVQPPDRDASATPSSTTSATPDAGKAQSSTDSGAAGSGGAPSAATGGAGAGAPAEAPADAPADAPAESSLDSEGCPIDLEGFASVADESQNGTTGGAAGEVVTVTNQADLTRYAEADEPYVIRVQGALKLEPKGKEILVASNKTIVGVGDSAEIV
ncbi:MAG TPA: hypothetical protein VMF89_24835, partial [Polyangiales bacterium]|nr:hypothetical protein [Polyangiales bacterium]